MLFSDPDQLLAEVLEDEGEEPVAVEGVAVFNMQQYYICLLLCLLYLVVEEHDETFEGTTGLPSQFSCFVDKLPTCMSKQMVDEVCTYAQFLEFIMYTVIVIDGY